MNDVSVSVVMSVFNGERFIDKAIKSILNQTFKNFEFIIINDGSTDKSEDYVLNYSDPRIIYVKNERNIGLAASLNKGIKLVKGKYVARMDDDDVSSPDRLQKQFELLESRADIGVIGSIAKYITEDDEYLFTTSSPAEDFEIKKKLPFFWFHHGSVMIRKNLLLECHGYDEWCKRIEDLLLWNKLALLTTFHVLQEPLYSWRLTVKGASNVKMSDKVKTFFNYLKKSKSLDEMMVKIREFDLEADEDQKNSSDSLERKTQYQRKVIEYAIAGKRRSIALKYFFQLLKNRVSFRDSVILFLRIIKPRVG